MVNRRDFLKNSGMAVGAIALAGGLYACRKAPTVAPSHSTMDPVFRDLLAEALNVAQMGGATFADARISRYLNTSLNTREQQVTGVADNDSIGCGVRVLLDGTWGFAATRELTKPAIAEATKAALAIAKANRVARDQAVKLAPSPVHPDATWKSAFQTDPWTVPIEDKVKLLLQANAEGMKAKNVKFVTSAMRFSKQERNYANSEGTFVTQTVIQSAVDMDFTAVGNGDFASRGNVAPAQQRGYEHILAQDLVGNAQRWGEQAAQKLTAKSVDAGQYDLILHPSHLWLTIHESIGHPTELDRAMGYEANYAGTSFLAPPEKVLGQLKYGQPLMNIVGDRSQPGGMATTGYDDDGVQPEDFMIIKEGIFNDYQTTRDQAEWLKWYYDKQKIPVRSHGCCYADSWSSVQFQRMPNASLKPGKDDTDFDDLIAATDRGIAIVGNGSYSIDQQRYNAQFGGQLFYEIKGGKIVGMLKDVAYQMRTPDFWNSMDMIGGERSYELWGSQADGKGQPGQGNGVSHGCPPARFRNITVLNTGRKA